MYLHVFGKENLGYKVKTYWINKLGYSMFPLFDMYKTLLEKIINPKEKAF